MVDINKEDIQRIASWRKAGLLLDVDSSSLTRADGIELIICSDGDHSHDWITHHHQFNKRIHIFSHHGGAAVLGIDELDNPLRVALLKQLVDGAIMKDIHTIVLGVHYPCAWARVKDISVDKLLLMLREAYFVTKALFSSYSEKKFPPQQGELLEVIPILHVFSGSKRRQYIVKM
ncbi:MAG: hypothetical protein WC575_01175 [Patescibacteria group bacterium]